MNEYISVFSNIIYSVDFCYNSLIKLYFQFFANEIIYVYSYKNANRKLIYSYWTSYLFPLLPSLTNEMYCQSDSLLEIVHNTDTEQVTTILKKQSIFHNFINIDKLTLQLKEQYNDFKTQKPDHLKSIMLVYTNTDEIITQFFKYVAHSFYISSINTYDFIHFLNKRGNKKIDIFKTPLSITIMNEDFDEHVFKENDIILW
jgi:hypothetical protein|uniref:Uncharacterized protein n=1 Tax=viral metagenome TaxID=1070528 RepID=A0A6C0BR45_9ZZZZ